MGTGYTRNDSSNNIADGNVINASDFDGEFDAIESALGTSGHTHDGTAAEGGPVTVIGPAQDLVATASEVKPKTDNTLDLGTASLQFKNAYFQGTIDTDGIMTAATFEPDGDTAAADNAAIGYTAAEGLILTGQGSTNDVTIKNDADADVIEIPTGTTNVTVAGNLGVGGTVTGTGTSVFASLDISGDIDVDGTTNLDVVDIDGAVNMATTALVTGVLTTTAAAVFNGGFAAAGVGTFADGSLSAPSITNTGDLDTGIFFPAADQVGFTAGGTSALLYNSAGNMIYTGSMQIQSDAQTGQLVVAGGNNSNDGANISMYGPSHASLANITRFRQDTTTSLTIAANADATFAADVNVGVDLDVAGNAVIDGTLSSGDITIAVDDTPTLNFKKASTADVLASINVTTDAGSGGKLVIQTKRNGDTAVDRLTIDDGGAATFAAGVTSTGATVTGANTSAATYATFQRSDAAVSARIRYDGSTAIIFGTSTNHILSFETNATPRFTIAADGSLSTPTLGTSNVRFGVNAGNSIASGGSRNVVIGDEAGTAISTGDDNVAIGYAALDAEDAHGRNVAIGSYALTNLDAGALGYNVAIGYECGTAMNTGVQNVVIGAFAGDAINSGTRSVVMGYNAGTAITSGDSNVAIGYQALMAEDTHSNNVAVGASALQTQNAGAHAYNVAVGFEAGKILTTGIRNTLMGGEAGDALTDADDNTAVGALALSGDTLGSKSTAIGRGALKLQNFTTATDSYNTAVGYSAGEAVTTGRLNTLVGGLVGDALTTGGENAAFGYAALTLDTLGSHTVAIGPYALQTQNFTTAVDSFNTAVGYAAGTAVTIGINNTFIGGLAGDADTKGNHTVALGYGAFTTQNFTTATDTFNTAVGSLAGEANATGVSNTFIGGLAGRNVTGGSNTAVGAAAMDAAVSGSQNTAVGVNALGIANGAANNNTAVGVQAGMSVTTGDNNLLLGVDAGQTGSPGGAITTASNEIVLGDENISAANIQVDWTVASDQRDKTDFTALDLGLDFVKALAPVTYKWDKRSKYGDKTADDYDLNAQSPDGTHKEDWLDIGFKAQEVQALEEAAGYTTAAKKNLTVSTSGDGKQMGLQYSKFVPILVKAMQEQNALIEALTARIVTLEG